MAEVNTDMGQQPVNIENLNFDKQTIEKLMKNQSFVKAFSALAPKASDPRQIALKQLEDSGIVKIFPPKAIRAMALALNAGADQSQIAADLE
jgi:hypothetical protein